MAARDLIGVNPSHLDSLQRAHHDARQRKFHELQWFDRAMHATLEELQREFERIGVSTEGRDLDNMRRFILAWWRQEQS